MRTRLGVGVSRTRIPQGPVVSASSAGRGRADLGSLGSRTFRQVWFAAERWLGHDEVASPIQS